MFLNNYTQKQNPQFIFTILTPFEGSGRNSSGTCLLTINLIKLKASDSINNLAILLPVSPVAPKTKHDRFKGFFLIKESAKTRKRGTSGGEEGVGELDSVGLGGFEDVSDVLAGSDIWVATLEQNIPKKVISHF